MSDIALFYDPKRGSADVTVASGDLASDLGFETAVMLSLFTDRRADDTRGWWGDSVASVAGDLHGSRLWLLSREKDQPRVLRQAEEYTREALAWMVEDQVAARIDVVAESVPAASQSELLLSVVIQRPDGTSASYRYAYNWESQAARRA
ncbi:GP46 family protein [Myxococcus stipitatus DSM 14675]|uniref:GP46 family protein n=1 Tax=Myxococcus stipitatus (strain DSM 14675 / JCM 12634 / Mx s8) TaxID=1278073 RepID=L7U5W5_MYXSD|nr:phage GP46 family protein [Myxococcus stipitatus]AGC43250.1 GP46 family protein [Myxococcus stipitatus DSM 14675]